MLFVCPIDTLAPNIKEHGVRLNKFFSVGMTIRTKLKHLKATNEHTISKMNIFSKYIEKAIEEQTKTIKK